MNVATQEFGTKIRALRTHRGLTQRELAELIGRYQADVSDMERGRLMPTVQTLKKLARALGIKPQALLSELLI